jgi:primosomal protein N' (replication factor Y)
MYRNEVEFRRRLGYPPFGRLVRMTYSHTGAGYSQEQAASMVHRLRKKQAEMGVANLDILGPSPAFVARIRGRWRWNVILRGTIRPVPRRRGAAARVGCGRGSRDVAVGRLATVANYRQG